MKWYWIITILTCVDIIYASCVRSCTCQDIWIQGSFLKTLVCPKRDLSIFPMGIDNTTQFMRLEGNRISEIPYNLSHIVPNLQRIDMSDNKVTRLRSRIFAGLKNLNSVNLVDNNITTLEDHIFEGSESEKMNLKLRGNRLKEINENAFRGLYATSYIDLRDNSLKRLYPNTLNGVRIVTLDLSRNQLNGLPDDLFQNQDRLYFLELGRNNISSLSSRVFDGLTELETLDLSSNELSTLPEDLFRTNKLNSITVNLDSNHFTSPPSLTQHAKVTVTLKNNPIICDCNLKRLLSNSSYKVEVKDFHKVVCANDTRTVPIVMDAIDCRTTTPPPTTTTNAPTTNKTTSTVISTTTTLTSTTNTTNVTQTLQTSSTTNTSTKYLPPTQKIHTTTLRTTLLSTTTTFVGIKVRPTGINRLTVLVSSMITVVVFVMVGIFCYINRQRILNLVRRPFKLYEGDRPWKTVTVRHRCGSFHINEQQNPKRSTEYLGWLTYSLRWSAEAANT